MGLLTPSTDTTTTTHHCFSPCSYVACGGGETTTQGLRSRDDLKHTSSSDIHISKSLEERAVGGRSTRERG